MRYDGDDYQVAASFAKLLSNAGFPSALMACTPARGQEDPAAAPPTVDIAPIEPFSPLASQQESSENLVAYRGLLFKREKGFFQVVTIFCLFTLYLFVIITQSFPSQAWSQVWIKAYGERESGSGILLCAADKFVIDASVILKNPRRDTIQVSNIVLSLYRIACLLSNENAKSSL